MLNGTLPNGTDDNSSSSSSGSGAGGRRQDMIMEAGGVWVLSGGVLLASLYMM